MAFAGRGSYGTVTVEGDRAIKKFKKLSHITQESIAAIFLQGHPHIVQFVSANFYEKKMVMQRHTKTLRKWMDFEGDRVRPVKQKIEVLRQILKGLMTIHSLKLVHGDMKPGNILLDEDPLHVVIADLGFISLRPFSKVERTAAVYRDKVVKSCHGHDIYSTAIIMLELFGELKINFQATYNQIHDAINDEIKDIKGEPSRYPIPANDFRKLLLTMTDSYHEARPSIAIVYQTLFGDKIEYPYIKNKFEIDIEIPEIKTTMKELSRKYNIDRANRGYKAVVVYITNYYHKNKGNNKGKEKAKISFSKRKYDVYSTSMIFILSSLFGKQNKFTESMAADYAGVNENEIISVVQKLSLNREVVKILMNP
jgi:serine/threonine protein kinase